MMEFPKEIKPIILEYFRRILNPDFEKRYILRMFLLGSVLLAPKIWEFASIIAVNLQYIDEKTKVNLTLGETFNTFAFIAGFALVGISAFLFWSISNRKKGSSIKEDSTSCQIPLEIIEVMENGLTSPEGTAKITFLFSQEEMKAIPFVNVNLKTIHSWDFPNGTKPMGSLLPVNPPPTPNLLVLPNLEESPTSSMVLSKNGESWVYLYTNHKIVDKFSGECCGPSVFMIQVTLSSKGFDDWAGTVLVRLNGGLERSTGTDPISIDELKNQIQNTQKILESAEKGATISNKLLFELKNFIKINENKV